MATETRNGNGHARRPIPDPGPPTPADRLPPHDRVAEQALLGCFLRDNRQFDATELGGEDDFYVFGHGCIFRGFRDLRANRREADIITIGDWLRGQGQLDEAGGHGYLVDLWDAAPGNPASAAHYAEIIQRKAIARRMIHACNDMAAQAFEPGVDVEQLLDGWQRAVFDLSTRGRGVQTVPQCKVRDLFLAELDRRRGAVADSPGEAIATGWRDLDTLLAGMFPSELIVLGARPGVGKTLVGNALARNVAGRGIPVLFISLEQRHTELFSRQVSAEGKIPSQRLRRGLMSGDEADRMFDAADRLAPLPIHYDDTPSQTALRIAATARRMVIREKVRLVIVDYLQLVMPENHREPRQEQVAGVSRRLKLLARELDVPVVALAQVNRGSEDRRDRRPRLSDLRESGAIEQDADTVIFLHKPEERDEKRLLDKLEVIVAKQRNGPDGEVFLMHDKQHFKIENYGGELPLLDV